MILKSHFGLAELGCTGQEEGQLSWTKLDSEQVRSGEAESVEIGLARPGCVWEKLK